MTILQRPAAAMIRLWDDRRAVSTVEFALILPLMLLIYAGSVELSEALSVDRKVNRVASTVADLIAQESTVSKDDVDNIFAASTAILEPYGTGPLTIQAIAVNITSSGEFVAWAEALNDTDPPNNSNSPIDIPDSIASEGTQVIVSRVTYEYESPFSSFMSTITGRTSYSLEHVYMMSPRLGQSVTWQN